MLVGLPVVVKATDVLVELMNAPAAGEVIVTVGSAATVKVVVAEPVLPAWSVAVTTIEWLPAARPLYGWPLVQLVAAAASSLQVVVVVVASVTVNVVVTAGPVVAPFAGAVIVTAGLTESTVNVTEALPEPAALVAVTTTV
jgi:hypothetical protein